MRACVRACVRARACSSSIRKGFNGSMPVEERVFQLVVDSHRLGNSDGDIKAKYRISNRKYTSNFTRHPPLNVWRENQVE